MGVKILKAMWVGWRRVPNLTNLSGEIAISCSLGSKATLLAQKTQEGCQQLSSALRSLGRSEQQVW